MMALVRFRLAINSLFELKPLDEWHLSFRWIRIVPEKMRVPL